jgi:hypothetical protein
MAFDWKSLVGTVAPTLATALGGPLAGVAAAAISDALLGKPNGSEAEIATALTAGGTDALLKLKQAEADFTVKMRELDIEVERIHQMDRASAREREAKTSDSFTPRMLAILVTSGFFGVLGYLLVVGKPADGDALLIMLGTLGGAWTAVVAYYFGSSAGSAQKTALMAKREQKQ